MYDKLNSLLHLIIHFILAYYILTASCYFCVSDAGKSTIGGQILFLSGAVDDRTVQKYAKEAKDNNRESGLVMTQDSILMIMPFMK